MEKVFDKLLNGFNKKWLLLFLIGTSILATLVISQVFGIIELIPEATVDSEMFYSSETLYQFLSEQGVRGRSGYLSLHLVDYLFITQFYMLLTIIITLLVNKLALSVKYRRFAMIPFVAGLFDLLENISVDISILNYPQKLTSLNSILPYFSMLKFALIYISFILICVLSIWNLVRWVHAKTKS